MDLVRQTPKCSIVLGCCYIHLNDRRETSQEDGYTVYCYIGTLTNDCQILNGSWSYLFRYKSILILVACLYLISVTGRFIMRFHPMTACRGEYVFDNSKIC